MIPDHYDFTDMGPICEQEVSVTCRKAQAQSTEPIQVFGLCGHVWMLSKEDSESLPTRWTRSLRISGPVPVWTGAPASTQEFLNRDPATCYRERLTIPFTCPLSYGTIS
jgi:hypothetical protein